MRLPLLVHARPKLSSGGPSVPLGAGRWHIVVERVVDSILTLRVNDVPLASLVTPGNGCFVQGPCVVSLSFVERGNEDYINVFAERSSGDHFK
jgi:hypothetical protein